MAIPLVKLLAGFNKDFCQSALGCLIKNLDNLDSQVDNLNYTLNNFFYLFMAIGVLNVLFILVVVFVILLALKTWRRDQEIASREWLEKKRNSNTQETLLPNNSTQKGIENRMKI